MHDLQAALHESDSSPCIIDGCRRILPEEFDQHDDLRRRQPFTGTIMPISGLLDISMEHLISRIYPKCKLRGLAAVQVVMASRRVWVELKLQVSVFFRAVNAGPGAIHMARKFSGLA